MITTPTAAAPAPQPDAQTAKAEPSVHSEQLTQFLTLLTTQIQNQDPLEPLDSTGFVEQLATFSTLEQQVQSNAHLEDILSALRG